MNFINLFSYPILVTEISLNLRELENYCLNLQENSNGRIKSNMYGWQSEDIKGEVPELNELLINIEEHSQKFFDFMQFKENLIPYISNLWININPTNSYNTIHSHDGAILSGVYYVKGNDKSGNIVFTNPCDINLFPSNINRFNEHNSLTYFEIPKAGKFLLFPGYMKHYVDMNTSDESRISISFNINYTEPV